MFIGRDDELERLRNTLNEDSSIFAAVYGRRRIGKTLLVREAFQDKFDFKYTGVHNCGNKKQLLNFGYALAEHGQKELLDLENWFAAFRLLGNLLDKSRSGRKVVFLDEIPWMDSPKSDFLPALEHFWNDYASVRNNIILIVCGSATSWIVKKVFKNRGGLHNRLTFKINLKPFTLKECEQYAEKKHLSMTRQQILETYMVIGGVPYYWDFMDKGKSPARNIDEMFFGENAKLEGEFEELYAALFKHPEPYITVVRELSKRSAGTSREEILASLKIKDGGKVSSILEDLENCGFIRKYNKFGTKQKYATYQLIDNFTIFYYKFLEGHSNNDSGYWELLQGTPAYNSWAGVSFERVCLQHIPQIKTALSIMGVISNVCAWRSLSKEDGIKGAQIDLLLDRNDRIINLCEMKFYSGEYTITRAYSENLRNKKCRFIEETGTRKAVHVTLITTYGVKHNEYWKEIQSEVTADDLFIK